MARILITDESGTLTAEIVRSNDEDGNEMRETVCRVCHSRLGVREHSPIADHIAAAETHLTTHGQG